MANVANTYLSDKDIRNLPLKEKKYRKVVGNPKELYIFINPKGTKKFALRLNVDGKEVLYGLKEFREGIYSVAEARKDAIAMLKRYQQLGSVDLLKNGNEKYSFGNLFKLCIEQKQKKGLNLDYLRKATQMCEKYLLPSLAKRDVKTISYSDLLTILNAIYNPNNPATSRLDTIRRLINFLHETFSLALKDRYIDFDPSYGLKQEFPTRVKFNQIHELDGRYPALIKDGDLREFIRDLKNDNRLEIQTKRAIYLQILSINRPSNTLGAKWEYIDLENALWTIPARDMKTKMPHEIPLTRLMAKILKEQSLFSNGVNEFIFPSGGRKRHITIEGMEKAIRNLGYNDKYKGKVTPHGFRATFRTICSQHKAELLELGISEEVIESALAHKEPNQVKFSYEREKATLEQKRVLLQWYEDYLNSVENLGI